MQNVIIHETDYIVIELCHFFDSWRKKHERLPLRGIAFLSDGHASNECSGCVFENEQQQVNSDVLSV